MDAHEDHQPVRIETAELASPIDLKIHNTWKDHQNYICFESSTSFIDKINEAAKHVQSFVPDCCKVHMNQKQNEK